MEPECRPIAVGRGGGVFLDRADGVRVVDVPQLGDQGELLGEVLGVVGQRASKAPAGRGLLGGWLVKCRQKRGQRGGGFCGARDGAVVGWRPRYPGGDDPRSRESRGGLAEALRNGDRRQEARTGSQVCSLRSSPSADSVAQGNRTARSSPSRHSWLSAAPCAKPHRVIGQAGMLVAQQIRTNSPVIPISACVMRSNCRQPPSGRRVSGSGNDSRPRGCGCRATHGGHRSQVLTLGTLLTLIARGEGHCSSARTSRWSSASPWY